MVDGAYHLIHEQLKPGVRENDIVANVNQFLYHHGSDDVEVINAISVSAAPQCVPHAAPRSSTAPQKPSWATAPATTRTFNVGRATVVQDDAYKKARESLDIAIDLIKPGVSTVSRCAR